MSLRTWIYLIEPIWHKKSYYKDNFVPLWHKLYAEQKEEKFEAQDGCFTDTPPNNPNEVQKTSFGEEEQRNEWAFRACTKTIDMELVTTSLILYQAGQKYIFLPHAAEPRAFL